MATPQPQPQPQQQRPAPIAIDADPHNADWLRRRSQQQAQDAAQASDTDDAPVRANAAAGQRE